MRCFRHLVWRTLLQTWSGMSSPRLFNRSRSYPSLPGMITRSAESRNSTHTARRGLAGSKLQRPLPSESLPRRDGAAASSSTRRPKKGPIFAGLSGMAICFVCCGTGRTGQEDHGPLCKWTNGVSAKRYFRYFIRDTSSETRPRARNVALEIGCASEVGQPFFLLILSR